jgi:hypothetical protein
MAARTLSHRDALIELLDHGLARLRRSGELERIRAMHYTH